jgi:leucyl-tRNA synthetase
VNRLWRLAQAADYTGTGGDVDGLRRKIHTTIDQLTQDLDKFHFNKAVARLRELSNALESHANAKGDGAVLKEGVETIVKLMSPMMPHLAEELWAQMGHKTLVVDAPWPVAAPEFLANDTVTIGIQVNGKLRATIQLPRDIDKGEAEKIALEEPAIQRATEGKTPKKVIVVPNRIINVVV